VCVVTEQGLLHKMDGTVLWVGIADYQVTAPAIRSLLPEPLCTWFDQILAGTINLTELPGITLKEANRLAKGHSPNVGRTTCNCKKDCVGSRCSCRKRGAFCGSGCGCEGRCKYSFDLLSAASPEQERDGTRAEQDGLRADGEKAEVSLSSPSSSHHSDDDDNMDKKPKAKRRRNN